MKSWAILVFLWNLLICIWAAPNAHAAVVKSILGRKALLNYSAEEKLRVGDKMVTSFEDGTQKAVFVITKLRKGQALTEIKAGNPEEGDSVRPMGATESLPAPTPTATPKPVAKKEVEEPPPLLRDTGVSFLPKLESIALLASYNLQSADVRLTNMTTVKTTGSSEALKFALLGHIRDLYPSLKNVNDRWIYNLSVGIDRIQTAGTGPNEVCMGSSNCTIDLFGYEPALELGYVVAPSWKRLSLHLGFDVFVPFTVSSNLVDGIALHPLSFYNLGAAMQFRVGKRSFIPVSIDFSSNVWSFDVIIHRYIFTIGYGW